MGELSRLGLGLGLVSPLCELNLEEFTLSDVLNPGVAEIVQRGTNRTALGVEYRFFECNVDNCAHKSIVFLRVRAPRYVERGIN